MWRPLLFTLLIFIVFQLSECKTNNIQKRALQKSHEKPQDEKWMEAFFGRNPTYDQVPSLVNLVKTLSVEYLSDCMAVFLYDFVVEKGEGLLLQQLFKQLTVPYIHGQITSSYKAKDPDILNSIENKCINYILFLADAMKSNTVVGAQNVNKVVVVARSSQWRVYEFLGSENSQSFVNLLVIAQSEKSSLSSDEMPFILYTHDLYIDALGSSAPRVLTSWIKNNFTRSTVNLFPPKITNGFEGHRFIISLAHQPPFVVKRGIDDLDNTEWDGSEVRLISLLSEIYNFTVDYREAKDVETLGSSIAVIHEIKKGKANLGIAGIYVTPESADIGMLQGHSQDCAAFVSLTSTALPRYRAIMGPFHWTVWLALTVTYLFAIFPIAFSDKHTLKPLLENPQEIENMFWYVFGTFTNCFSFTGKKSWNKSKMLTTRLLVGFYWLFTIITTACYTGSIIAFVTLPVYPSTVDSVKQLLSGRYQIGTLDKGGWQYWFENSSDPTTIKLFKDIEFVPNVESGLKNTTRAFFWPYAFLGSRAQLDYIVRTNFTTRSKRSVLHISSECFVPYSVGISFAKNAVYKMLLNEGILRAFQSGFMIKFSHDFEWEVMRSATGKLLQASSGTTLKALTVDDRALTLDDTQGMFLLLGAGFLMGGGALLSEWFGGCFNLCKKRRGSSSYSIESNHRSYDTPTPRDKINSIQYNSNSRLGSIIDIEARDFDVGRKLNEKLNSVKNKLEKNNSIESNHFKENHTKDGTSTATVKVDLIVHKENSSNDSHEDYDAYINKLFNFDELFGEENTQTKKITEEINEDNQSLKPTLN